MRMVGQEEKDIGGPPRALASNCGFTCSRALSRDFRRTAASAISRYRLACVS